MEKDRKERGGFKYDILAEFSANGGVVP